MTSKTCNDLNDMNEYIGAIVRSILKKMVVYGTCTVHITPDLDEDEPHHQAKCPKCRKVGIYLDCHDTLFKCPHCSCVMTLEAMIDLKSTGDKRYVNPQT